MRHATLQCAESEFFPRSNLPPLHLPERKRTTIHSLPASPSAGCESSARSEASCVRFEASSASFESARSDSAWRPRQTSGNAAQFEPQHRERKKSCFFVSVVLMGCSIAAFLMGCSMAASPFSYYDHGRNRKPKPNKTFPNLFHFCRCMFYHVTYFSF